MLFFFMAGLLFAPSTECVLFPPASLPPLDGGQPAHPIFHVLDTPLALAQNGILLDFLAVRWLTP
jgi:hypothetical protein